MLTALTAAALLAAGYTLGRCRPWRRASDWAWWNVGVGKPRWTRRQVCWWLAQGVFAIEIAGALVTRPRLTLRVWRHRHDPPPPRSPVMTFRHVSRTDDTDTTET